MAEINERQKAWAISREELDLRWQCMYRKITLDEFNKKYELLKKQGKIIRDGRAIK